MTKIGNFLETIDAFIRAVIITYIINPIKRWYNFYFRHTYIPANERNLALLDFCLDVANNPEREAETPTEIFFENSVKNDYDRVYTEPNDPPWEEMRQHLFLDLARGMMELRWIEEDKDN